MALKLIHSLSSAHAAAASLERNTDKPQHHLLFLAHPEIINEYTPILIHLNKNKNPNSNLNILTKNGKDIQIIKEIKREKIGENK